MIVPDPPGLFDHLSVPASDPPDQRQSPTSRDARRRAKSFVPRVRERLLAYLRRRGSFGATDAEMQNDLNIDGSTQRPARVALVRQRRVKDSGHRRATPAGRQACVWTVVPTELGS